jgi:hypothetical protein
MKTVVFLTIALSLGINWPSILCQQGDRPAKASLIISGEVLEVGDPPKSNDFPFQLIRYRVADVCEGVYDQGEILVYHMVSAKGMRDIKRGDKVCLGVIKSFGIESKKDGRPPEGLATAYLDTDIFIRRCQCSRL